MDIIPIFYETNEFIFMMVLSRLIKYSAALEVYEIVTIFEQC